MYRIDSAIWHSGRSTSPARDQRFWPATPRQWIPTACSFRATSTVHVHKLSQTGKGGKNGHNTNHHSNPHAYRRNAHLATQQELGILSQRRTRIGSSDSDHPFTSREDIKIFLSTLYHLISTNKEGVRHE